MSNDNSKKYLALLLYLIDSSLETFPGQAPNTSCSQHVTTTVFRFDINSLTSINFSLARTQILPSKVHMPLRPALLLP